MIYRKLPPHVRKRVNKYFEFKYQGKMFDERSILEEFNECLQQVNFSVVIFLKIILNFN